MARTSIFAGWLVIALLVTGCAGVGVNNKQSRLESETIARPERVFVYDFASTVADLPKDSAIAGLIEQRTTSQTQEEIEFRRQLGALVAVHLIEELNERDIPATAAGAGLYPRTGDAVVHGEFVLVDEGSRIQRVLLGFGAGAARLVTLAEVYVVVSGGLVPLSSVETETHGSRMSGMLVSLGIGTVVSIASGVASKVYSETGAESIGGAAKRTAKEVAEQMVTGYQRRGWM